LPVPGELGFSGTNLKITTVADTWIYLNFFDGGERNRGLTIIKSRGTNHSNQVRELILSCSGLSIAPPYTADGTVLMGTLRWQKERAEAETLERLKAEYERQDAALSEELAGLEARVQTLQRSIVTKRLAQNSMTNEERNRKGDEVSRYSEMIRLRQSELGISKTTQLAPNRKTADGESRP
jgi:circadian clock protein KaiC